MTISDYLAETRHATSTLIDSYTYEWRAHLNAAKKYNNTVDEFKSLEEVFPADTRGLLGLTKISEAFQKTRENYVKMRKFHEMRLERFQSTTILCGALLQIAKQGISVVYQSKSNASPGRAIGGTCLREVVWQGRNQALHYEDNNFHSPVVVCFQALETSFGSRFSLSTATNLAIHVVDVLGWHTLQKYEADMLTL